MQVINILSPFLAFALTYNQAKVHNMLAIMLDPHFKNMKVILDFVGHAHAIQIVTNYDINIVCPLLLQVFFHLKPIRATTNQLTIVEDDDLFFG